MDNKNICHIPFFEFPANIVESFLIACYGGPLNNCQGVYLMAKQLRSVSIMNASIQNLETNITISNVVSQYQFAYENDEFNLMKKCVELIKSRFKYVKLFNEFQNLPKNILHELAVNVAMSPNLEIF
uniref:BTB domain-containing protein n=1 Tax=Panagrolaimus sp. PS1159 TaxID=55785 RepID=A0AC35FS73_9BILA